MSQSKGAKIRNLYNQISHLTQDTNRKVTKSVRHNTTWRYGILKDIHKLGLRGRLPTFIENFLANRAMQVRVGSSLSDYYDEEQGVPQGGVLSTTLFSIKINDIVKCLGNLTDCSLYVDDFCICYCSKAWRQLNVSYNKI